MTIHRIPTSTDPKVASYTQRTALDGREYVLAFDWNPTDAHWYIGIRDENGDSIREGMRAVVGFPLLRRCVDPRCPPGELVIEDLSGAHDDPRFGDFGTRTVLRYYDAAEVRKAIA